MFSNFNRVLKSSVIVLSALTPIVVLSADTGVPSQADYYQGFETLTSEVLAPATIHTQFPTPDSVPGIVGNAWRSDGFSSWLTVPQENAGKSAQQISAVFWVALESYPSDHEVRVQDLSPGSLINQWGEGGGFDVYLDTYGRWGVRVQTEAGMVTLPAPERFPLYHWHQLAVSILPDRVSLYLDGTAIAEQALAAPMKPVSAPVTIARSPNEAEMLNFTINRLNGAFDELQIFARGLTRDQVSELHAQVQPEERSARASLVVPASRFADDHLRPQLHAMPPANWTNEPHGFVRVGDVWHLFYQRTPNGPYKTQMHWGHMVSRDLVNWENLEDALWPELQTDNFGFDMKGIWSGDVIYDGGKAFAFYTSVNHFDRLKASNPGVSMAVSEDPMLRHWKKLGPIVNTKYVPDFRDPYLFRDGNTWHMLIGAALKSGGGLDYYVLEPGEGGGKWQHRRKFISESYRDLDNGSLIWEMPVFEPISDDAHVLVVNPIGGAVSKYGEPATRAVYWVGEWKEGVFHPYTTKPKHLDILPGHLAPTVERTEDGSLRAIGIVDERRTSQAQEDAGWAHTFSFPRRWFLMEDGRSLGQAPAPELSALRKAPVAEQTKLAVSGEGTELFTPNSAYELLVKSSSGHPIDLELDILANPQGEVTRLRIDGERNRVVLDKSRASTAGEDEGPNVLEAPYDAAAFGAIETLRVFVDGSVVEVFINDAAVFSFRSYPENPAIGPVTARTPDGASQTIDMTAWPLQLP